MFTYEQLYRCYLECRKNKRNTLNQLEFEINVDINLLRLEEELNNRTYKPQSSLCFIIEKPKLREIFAATFKDRIVHYVLIEYLNKVYEPKFIYDSYACRVERGTHSAIFRLQKFTRQVTKNNTQNACYMQLDISSFFLEINKNVLENILTKKVDDNEFLWLANIVIWNDCTKDCRIIRGKDDFNKIPRHKSLFYSKKNKGLPIGNLSSQFFANLYLNELDQYIKRELKCKFYIRYMDDFILLSEEKEELVEWMNLIEIFLNKKLDLILHPTKRIIAPISNGIDFVGYIVRPNYILVRKRVIGNLKNKIWNGLLNLESWSSYLGHFKHAQTKQLTLELKKKPPFDKSGNITPKKEDVNGNKIIN